MIISGGLRVLSLIDSIQAGGGAETSLATMAPALTAHGIELHVAYFHQRVGLDDELRAGGARLHLIGEHGRLKRVLAVHRLIEEVRPDVVHTTLFEADLAGRLAGRWSKVPVVSSLVSTGFELGPLWSGRGVRARAAALADSASAQVVTRFHAVSEAVAEDMGRRLRVPRDRFTVIPRGRDPVLLGRRTESRRRRARQELALNDADRVVLAVGRQVPPKALPTLIAALPDVVRNVPPVKVLLVGHMGPDTETIAALVAQLGLDDRVLQLGHRSDVAELMVAADVLVLPSVREGFPGTLVEALALELPIVASDLRSVRAVVGERGSSLARLVPARDHTALATAITEVLSSERDVDSLAAGRWQFDAHFTVDAVAARMAALLRATAKRS